MTVSLPLKQAILKDMPEPIKQIRPYSTMIVAGSTSDSIDWQVMELAPNEFTSYEDYVGLFDNDPEPVTFFSLEKVAPNPLKIPLSGHQILKQPKALIELKLSNQKYEHER